MGNWGARKRNMTDDSGWTNKYLSDTKNAFHSIPPILFFSSILL